MTGAALVNLNYIDFWDVGQGDCTVLHFLDQSIMIIDTGLRGSGLVDWLSEPPQRLIRGIILSHNDADHCGALPSIIQTQGHNIGAIHMLQDRPKDSRPFEQLFRRVLEWEKSTGRQIKRLEAGDVLWESADSKTCIRVQHPSFSEAVLAKNPNSSSALIALEHEGNWLAVWPGDLGLPQMHSKVAGKSPTVLVGPHHGAPSGYDAKNIALQQISEIAAKNAFISVGTRNDYDHPRPRYLLNLARSGCRIRCSEITKVCDRETTRGRAPVFDGTGHLGLRAPRTNGVPCRGAWRVYFQGDQLVPDKYSKDHILAVSTLKRPRCLQGRGWKKGMSGEAFV